MSTSCHSRQMLQRKVPVGILGGSFNPAHAGHLQISLNALCYLDLEEVWWIVSPGNPLKDQRDMQPFDMRVDLAMKVADHPRIRVCNFEYGQKVAYTSRSLMVLRAVYPAISFVWLMGADNLVNLHLWKDWSFLMDAIPIAVFDRPGYRDQALSSPAAIAYKNDCVHGSDVTDLAFRLPPAWTFLTAPLSKLSSTWLRSIENHRD